MATASKPQCFVIMPIGAAGTPDHRHFKTIYGQIKAQVEAAGYEVFRADDVQESGMITKDIIRRLAVADIVVADVTSVNPNVFYELGVRHALRGAGTIMVLDTARTPEIPFDLRSYRVIQFTGDLEGVEDLKSQLAAFVERQSPTTDPERRDNPVHDTLPELPVDALGAATGTVDRSLTAKLNDLQLQVSEYEKRFGTLDSEPPPSSELLDAITNATARVKGGRLVTQLVTEASEAADRTDTERFLEVARGLFDEGADAELSELDFMRLAIDARKLGLWHLANAIYRKGIEVHPRSARLEESHLRFLSHSPDRADRDRARRELGDRIGIEVKEEAVVLPAELDSKRTELLGLMLDAYHEDELNEDSLRVTSAMVERFPGRSALLRNHARALERAGRPPDEFLSIYRDAVLTPDVDDTSAVWFGAVMGRLGRHVDSLECYLLACTLDPDDAANFIAAASACTIGLRQSFLRPDDDPRGMPEAFGSGFIQQLLVGAFSCGNLDNEDLGQAQLLMSVIVSSGLIDLPGDFIAELARARMGAGDFPEEEGPRTLKERREFAVASYRLVASELTRARDELAA